VDENSSGDCHFWALVIMAPAFFYHTGWGSGAPEEPEELKTLIAPLQNILPTLSATLFMIIPRILAHWIEIIKYVERFIAGQDTFLHEKWHDQLLFDDDNFTRSRQYFWVISSTGEFILIIEETINHYENFAEWVSRSQDEENRHSENGAQLEAIKEKFERQRTRATELRDGVSSMV
jgi:hypothetical protein